MVEANFKLYRDSTAVTEYREFPKRTHYLWARMAGNEWQTTPSTGP